jgi:hypothetical protein
MASLCSEDEDFRLDDFFLRFVDFVVEAFGLVEKLGDLFSCACD